MEGVIGLIWRYGNNDYQINLMEFSPKEKEILDRILQNHEDDASGVRGDALLTIESANIAHWERKWSAEERNKKRLKLAHEIYQLGMVETDVFYDHQEDEDKQLTYDDIANNLQTYKGTAYQLESLMQFCDGSQTTEDHDKFFKLSMEIVHYMEGFNNE